MTRDDYRLVCVADVTVVPALVEGHAVVEGSAVYDLAAQLPATDSEFSRASGVLERTLWATWAPSAEHRRSSTGAASRRPGREAKTRRRDRRPEKRIGCPRRGQVGHVRCDYAARFRRAAGLARRSRTAVPPCAI
jgi:hypothetical protein